MTPSRIDKNDLAKVIAPRISEPELFLEWVSRQSTEMKDVLKWATEDEIAKTQQQYNEYN